MKMAFTLDRIMASKRLSIVELSDRTGLSLRQIELIRSNEAIAIKLTTIGQLCEALNCTPNDLIGAVSLNEGMD